MGVSYGDYSFFQTKASASGPLVDGLVAGRLSGVLTQRDGVIRNLRTGQDLNTLNNYAVRGQLLFTIDPAPWITSFNFGTGAPR